MPKDTLSIRQQGDFIEFTKNSNTDQCPISAFAMVDAKHGDGSNYEGHVEVFAHLSEALKSDTHFECEQEGVSIVYWNQNKVLEYFVQSDDSTQTFLSAKLRLKLAKELDAFAK
jgi:hypothetical protein